MPLRDHFRPPPADRRTWEGFHGGWPMMIAAGLNRGLPRRYVAEPRLHQGSSIEVDVASYEEEWAEPHSAEAADDGGGVATAVWAPPRPTLAVQTDLPALDEYEVRVHDTRSGLRLVAAIEIVSPANKDRPERRRVFVAKCAGLLQDGVCVAMVDLVTNRSSNIYVDLMELLGSPDPAFAAGAPSIYAAAWRWTRNGTSWLMETWAHALEVGRVLPTLPLWLAENLAVQVDLESSYEETCRNLRIG
ncbi:MAG: DUF4058 family protein [Isosphaeraceae bacterium]